MMLKGNSKKNLKPMVAKLWYASDIAMPMETAKKYGIKELIMLQVRHGVFETNSSSTHSITLCKKSEYDAWVNGEVYLNDGWWVKELENRDKKFLTREEAVKLITDSGHYKDTDLYSLDEAELLEIFNDEEIYDTEWYDNMCEYYETYEVKYTTESGEDIIAFGYYGNDY